MFPLDAKILIVDDSEVDREAVCEALGQLSYKNVLVAVDATEAQHALLNELNSEMPVQLVICDIHMPKHTGLQLLKWLRGRTEFKAMPMIMLTSSQGKNDIIEAAQMGVSHYMLKPVTSAVLKERMLMSWAKHGQFFWALSKK